MYLSPFSLLSLLVGVAAVGRGHLPSPAKMLAYFGQNSQVELAAGSKYHVDDDDSFATRLVHAALHQVGTISDYDERYPKIPFPNGDVPATVGTNADLIVRSYRGAGIDLQTRIYQDKTASRGSYPSRKGSSAPDTNVDQRHVPTLAAFFARKGSVIPVSHRADDYKPGDIITCRTTSGSIHIAIVVPAPVPGPPWIVHNLHWGPRLEDKLFECPITGHFRYLPGP